METKKAIPTKWTRKKLIWSFKTLVKKIGAQPTKKQWLEDVDTPSDMPVRMQFGNWNNFVKACGYEPYKPYLSDLAKQKRNEAHLGKRSFNWKGGRHIDKNGYVQVWKPEHPNARLGGYIHEHRLIMSEHLGRPLLKNENVHHKNGIRDDNRLENLELWSTMQPAGKRPEDLLKFAKEIINIYENPKLLSV